MEMAAEEVVYMVERIIGMRWAKGDRQYHVVWEGYEEKDSTWEPMENLVGCAAQIRAYEAFQKEEDRKAKEEILKKRKDKRDKAAADAEALKAAAAANLAGGEEIFVEDSDGEEDGSGTPASGCLPMHNGKRKPVWRCFDLTCEKPKCKLIKPGTADTLCGEPVPLGQRRHYQLLVTSLYPPQAGLARAQAAGRKDERCRSRGFDSVAAVNRRRQPGSSQEAGKCWC